MGDSEFIVNEIKVVFRRNKKRRKGLFYQPDYQFRYEDIAIIGISLMLVGSEEENVFVFIDKTGRKYFISGYDNIPKKQFWFIMGKYNLTFGLIKPYEWEDYSNEVNEVIYPKLIKGKPLFGESSLPAQFWHYIQSIFRIKHIADKPLSNELVSVIPR